MLRALFFSFLAIVLFTTCGPKEEELFVIDLEAKVDFVAPLSTFVTHVYVVKDIANLISLYAEQKGFSMDDIGRISPVRSEMDGLFQDNNYKIFERMIVYIEDSEDPEYRREIFFKENVDLNHSGPLQLFGSTTNIKEFLEKDSYNLAFEFRLRAPLTHFLENRFEYSFVAYRNE